MIPLEKMRLFPVRTPLFKLPLARTEEDSYNIIFYPENSVFTTAYNYLRIKRVFVRIGTIVPYVGFPKMIVTPKLLSIFRSLKLIPRRKLNMAGHSFVDMSPFFSRIDGAYGRKSYRRPIVLSRILSYLNQIKEFEPQRKNILLYYVDLNQNLPLDIFSKRSWPLVSMVRSKEYNGKLPFEYVIIALKRGGKVLYYLLSNPNASITPQRFFIIMKSLKTLKNIEDVEKVKEEENKDFSDNVSNNLEEPEDKRFVKKSVEKYTEKIKEKERENLVHNKILTDETSEELALVSMLTNVSGDINKAKQIVSTIPKEKMHIAFTNVKNMYKLEDIKEDVYVNKSRDIVYEKANIQRINQNANPSKILNKRKIDFETIFEDDLKKSFSLLEKKSKHPLKVVKFKKESVPVEKGDLEPSKLVRYNITLKDDLNKNHDIVIEIPEIQSDGTFLINGLKQFLMYQIIIDPIFFIKKDQAQFQTLYASTAVHLKRTKYKNYFEIYISGYHLPLFLLMAYYMGFEKLCKLFNIGYTFSNEKPQHNNYITLKNNEFLIFEVKDAHSKFLINSLKEVRFEFTKENILNQETFKNAVIKQVGNRNSIYQINLVLENIMEPISVQILKNKLLPTTYQNCIYYICKELAAGRIDRRNDISKQRIRSSEVFSYQIQKLILGSYTDYFTKREHGDTDTTYYCDTRNIVSDIVNSQLFRPLENINPIEELSTLTRVTPVGPGGIPDKHATTRESRNTNESYYGNFEPNDTPEGDNVGMINQLTVEAAINNIRGSFSKNDIHSDIGCKVLSPTTSLIPYVSSCDGSRVLIGASQAKGAIPIVGVEQPLVQTGFESTMTSMLTDSYIKKAPIDGKITKITEDVIYVQDLKSRKIEKVALDTVVLNSAQGQNSLNRFTPTVFIGQSVKKGHIIAEGKHIKDGIISTGTNLLMAVMGWKGYSFEDGYVISEKIANTKLVSETFDEIEVFIDSDDVVKFINEHGKETVKGEPLLIRTSRKIETLVGLDEDELYEGQIIKKSPGGKIISLEIYPNISIKKFPILQEEFEKFKIRYQEMKGEFPSKFFINEGSKKAAYNGIKVIFKIERKDACLLGDKITNMHGGKGVICLIEKTENMPVTPWGESIDIILNPVSIINRMNPSTIFELHTGLIAKFLAYKIVSYGPKKNLKALKLIKDVYTALDNTKNKILSKNIYNSFLSLSDKQYAGYIQKIVNRNYVIPIYVPPFQQPTKNMLYNALSIVDAKPTYYLKIPETNQKILNPVAVGYLYIRKLEHQAAYKVSSRGIGRINSNTGQPIQGSSRGGGQRFGEFDTWCITSRGAINVLKELMGPLSDDKTTKDQILSEIIENGEAEYKEPLKGQTKALFDVYLKGMMVEALID